MTKDAHATHGQSLPLNLERHTQRTPRAESTRARRSGCRKFYLTWHVVLVGMAKDYPSLDEAGFIEFARSLLSPRLYDAIKNAQPLTNIIGYRQAENRLRHFEKLPRALEGFVALGDSVYALNPVYGQGMSVATMGALKLDECLRLQHARGKNLNGLGARFQKQLAGVLQPAWQMSTGEDLRWSATKGSDRLDAPTRWMQNFISAVMRAANQDARITDTLYRPDVLFRMWRANRSLQNAGTSPLTTRAPRAERGLSTSFNSTP